MSSCELSQELYLISDVRWQLGDRWVQYEYVRDDSFLPLDDI